tara:strand:+ start:223 stop:735 length:513 start_codon:yes stop_codon:yes gene_type:complete
MSEVKNCEYYGYKVGDKFRIIDKEGVASDIGNCNILTLSQDDGSDCPKFDGDNGNRGYASLCALEKIDEKTEWNGEGLPPVGTVCELSMDDGEFKWCLVRFIGEKIVVVDHKNYKEQTYKPGMIKFRPIRTKRDEWIDAAMLAGGIRKRDGAREVYGNLYDAGLAKDIEE